MTIHENREARSRLAHAARPALRPAFLGLGLIAILATRPVAGQTHQAAEIPAASGIQVQSLEALGSTTIIAELHDGAGQKRASLARPGVDAGTADNIYLPAEPSVGSGSYATRLISDGRFGVLVRSDDVAPDHVKGSAAAALYRQPIPAETVLLPLALKRYRGQSSRLSIQNASAEQALGAQLSLVPLGSTQALVSLSLQLKAAGSQRIDLARDPRLADLPDGFLGYARIEAEAGGRLLAVSHVDVADRSWGIYALEGLSVDEAGARIILPRIRHTPPRVSGIAVVNVGEEPAAVELRYHALPGPTACGPAASWMHQAAPTRLLPGQQHVFYAASPGPAGNPIVPAGCQAWAELLAAEGSLLAAVVEAEVDDAGLPIRAGAYVGTHEALASTLLFLPLFRRRHLRQEISTPLSLVNPGALPATVRIEAYDICGEPLSCGLGCEAMVPPGESLAWHPDAIPEPARPRCKTGLGLFGSAVVTSDQPLALVVFDEARVGDGDFAAYDALRRPESANPPNGRFFEAFLPMFDCFLPGSRSVGCRRP